MGENRIGLDEWNWFMVCISHVTIDGPFPNTRDVLPVRLQGPAGMEFNIEIMKTLRDVVGSTDEIIIDPLTRWDYIYASQWCKAAESAG